MFRRELTISERCSLINLRNDTRMTGRRSNEEFITPESLCKFHDRTVAEMTTLLDTKKAPTHTTNPYPLVEVVEWLANQNKSLDAAIVTDDLNFSSTTHGYLEFFLDKALQGELQRVKNTTIRLDFPKQDAPTTTMHLYENDMLIRRPKDATTYVYFCAIQPVIDKETVHDADSD